MNNVNLKKLSAESSMNFVENGFILGLGGGGRSIGYMIEMLSEKVKGGFKVKVVTPSLKTKHLCIKKGIEVLPTSTVSKVDIAFDGCDQVDESLNALKSGGGIHTREKLIASMSDQYILLADEKNLFRN